MKNTFLSILTACILTIACNAQKNNNSVKNATIARYEKFEANVESLTQYETPEWFRDAKFGIWNVIGPYSVAEQGEWYACNPYIMEHDEAWQLQGLYHRKHQSKFGYKDFNSGAKSFWQNFKS